MIKPEPNIVIYCEACQRVLYRGDLIGKAKFKELTRNKCRYCHRELKEDFKIRGKPRPQTILDKFNGETK